MNIEELFQSEGKYVGPTFGTSMQPMLKTGRDSVVIFPKTSRLAVYDVGLYKNGDKFVLHRVVRVLKDGYVFRGDNCYKDELVEESRVIGVLTEYFKGEKRVRLTDKKYLHYARRRVKLYGARRFFYLAKFKIKSAIKKLIGYKNGK